MRKCKCNANAIYQQTVKQHLKHWEKHIVYKVFSIFTCDST